MTYRVKLSAEAEQDLDRIYLYIEAETSHAGAYAYAYASLEAEFALASTLIKARSEADMTQEQVAQAMGTTQAVVARLEGGKILPSTPTLERLAKATRTRLRITFEPQRKAAR